jgi:hypothetical protein
VPAPEFDQFPKGYVTQHTPYIAPSPVWGTAQTVQLKGAYPQGATESKNWTDKS